MPRLEFRLPGRADGLGAWLAKLFPECDRATRRRWVEDAQIRVDDRVVDRLGIECAPGARVEIADVPEALLPMRPPGAHSQWLGLIDHPPWRRGSLDLHDSHELQFSIEEIRGGLAIIRLRGSACDAASLCKVLARAEMPVVGDLVNGGLGAAGGLRLISISSADADRDGQDPAPRTFWPVDPAWRSISDRENFAVGDSLAKTTAHQSPNTAAPAAACDFRVSDETARALNKGHPWILPDASSDPHGRDRPGSVLRIVSRKGQALGWAHAEGDRRLLARVWAIGDAAFKASPSIEARVARALAHRRSLLAASGSAMAHPNPSNATNAFRLIHGEGDALPGLFVDRLGPLLRVLVTGRASDLFRERVIDALKSQLPLTPEGDRWSILELLHIRSSAKARFERVRWRSGGIKRLAESADGLHHAGFHVAERGLRFDVDPGWVTPTSVRPGFGLFFDQRENRARLAVHARRGGHWLNLFAHTGAFSASLLAAGAERVTSVDLSPAYLKRLETNLALNADRGVDLTRNESIRSDGRRYLEVLPPNKRFAGIVLDPPTAAAAGRRYWSLNRDLEPLLRHCVSRLAEGGVLLVTQNRKGLRLDLDAVLERIVDRAGRHIVALTSAPAGSDHPQRTGFPEGEPFEGWLLALE